MAKTLSFSIGNEGSLITIKQLKYTTSISTGTFLDNDRYVWYVPGTYVRTTTTTTNNNNNGKSK